MNLPPGYTKIEPPTISQSVSNGIVRTRVLAGSYLVEVFNEEGGPYEAHKRKAEITHRVQVQLKQLLSNPDLIPLEHIRPIKKTSYRANSEPRPEPRSAQASSPDQVSEPSPRLMSQEELLKCYRAGLKEAETLHPEIFGRMRPNST